MTRSLTGKVALVTGAGKGIGAGIPKAVPAAGVSVVVNFASDRPGAERVVADIKAAGGSAFAFASLERTTDVQLHTMLDTNLWGTIITCREALKHFGNDGGSIINIGSMSSERFSAGAVAYTTSKAGITGVTGSSPPPENQRQPTDRAAVTCRSSRTACPKFVYRVKQSSRLGIFSGASARSAGAAPASVEFRAISRSATRVQQMLFPECYAGRDLHCHDPRKASSASGRHDSPRANLHVDACDHHRRNTGTGVAMDRTNGRGSSGLVQLGRD
jgi:short chain dehydrogenase